MSTNNLVSQFLCNRPLGMPLGLLASDAKFGVVAANVTSLRGRGRNPPSPSEGNPGSTSNMFSDPHTLGESNLPGLRSCISTTSGSRKRPNAKHQHEGCGPKQEHDDPQLNESPGTCPLTHIRQWCFLFTTSMESTSMTTTAAVDTIPNLFI